MQKMIVVAVTTILVLLAAGAAQAMQHEATVDKGRALFNDPRIGTTGKSCNDCHKNGTGLEKSGQKTDLDAMVNTCIRKGLKGKGIRIKSTDMASMVLYLKSLGAEKMPVGK